MYGMKGKRKEMEMNERNLVIRYENKKEKKQRNKIK
jgi:hypothetical protein